MHAYQYEAMENDGNDDKEEIYTKNLKLKVHF